MLRYVTFACSDHLIGDLKREKRENMNFGSPCISSVFVLPLRSPPLLVVSTSQRFCICIHHNKDNFSIQYGQLLGGGGGGGGYGGGGGGSGGCDLGCRGYIGGGACTSGVVGVALVVVMMEVALVMVVVVVLMVG